MHPSRFKLPKLIPSLQGTKSEENYIFDYTIVKAKSKFSGPNLKPTFRILKLFFFLLYIFLFIRFHFYFKLLLPEGRAGEAWEPSNKVMLFLPKPKLVPLTNPPPLLFPPLSLSLTA
jgi:hypothetical protein